METCTLAALIACFSWSGFYMDSGVQFQDTRITQERVTPLRVEDSIGNVLADGQYTTQFTQSRNPYVRAALGYQINFTSVMFTIQAEHESSIATGRDKGTNSIFIGARWFPFR